MKKRDVINILLLLTFIAYIYVYKTIVLTKYLKSDGIITSLFLIFITFIAFLFLGYRKNKSNLKKKNITNLIIYESIVFFFLYFGSGLIFGFLNSFYSMKINKILSNMFCPFVIIVASELFRYIVVQANKDKKIMIVLVTMALATLEVMFTINYYDLTTFEGCFKLTALGIVPALSESALLTFLSYYAGIKNALIYKLIMSLYVYVAPIVPDLGDYCNCLIEIFFPFIVYCSVSSIVYKNDYVEADYKEKKFTIGDAIITAIFLAMVSLVGGIFNVKLMSVVSNSMLPVIERGDAVVVKKTNTDLKVDDIISFSSNGRNTIHRIVEIEEIDGIIYYHTKGDNNNAEDTSLVPVNNIYGKVLFKIPYIGYPSVWVYDYRGGISEK